MPTASTSRVSITFGLDEELFLATAAAIELLAVGREQPIGGGISGMIIGVDLVPPASGKEGTVSVRLTTGQEILFWLTETSLEQPWSLSDWFYVKAGDGRHSRYDMPHQVKQRYDALRG